MTAAEHVVWHDLECGGYDEDLPLWRELAAARAAPVLDVGAGTGRVALDLAAPGHEVVGARPRRRAARRRCASARRGPAGRRTVAADARDFDLGRRFALVARADADAPAARRRRRPRALPALRARAPRARRPARARAGRRARGLRRASTTSRRRPTCARSTAWSTPAARSRSATAATAPRIERVREIVAPDGARTTERRRRSSSTALDARRARGRGAPRSASRAEPRGRIPADRRLRRLDGGDAPWLSARCASARCTPT